MYKILTKMHTERDGVYRVYMIEDDKGCLVEYSTDNKDEVVSTALEILKRVGCADLKIVEDCPYYLEIKNVIDNNITTDDIEHAEELIEQVGYRDLYLINDADYDVQLIWGEKPETETPIYVVSLEAPEGMIVTPDFAEVEEHGSVEVTVTSAEKMGPYHLIINGEECSSGIPSWITFELIDDYSGKAILSDITQDYNIIIVADK